MTCSSGNRGTMKIFRANSFIPPSISAIPFAYGIITDWVREEVLRASPGRVLSELVTVVPRDTVIVSPVSSEGSMTGYWILQCPDSNQYTQQPSQWGREGVWPVVLPVLSSLYSSFWTHETKLWLAFTQRNTWGTGKHLFVPTKVESAPHTHNSGRLRYASICIRKRVNILKLSTQQTLNCASLLPKRISRIFMKHYQQLQQDTGTSPETPALARANRVHYYLSSCKEDRKGLGTVSVERAGCSTEGTVQYTFRVRVLHGSLLLYTWRWFPLMY